MIVLKSRKLLIVIMLAGSAAVQACRPSEQVRASAPAAVEILGPEHPYQPVTRPTSPPESEKPALEGGSWFEGLARLDSQGAVEVEVIPRPFDLEDDRLDFEVSLNTHSIDLSMDLVPLSVLVTDTGLAVPAIGWTGQPGGHHISGVLSFPSEIDRTSILSEVTRIEITIRDIDASARIFVWER